MKPFFFFDASALAKRYAIETGTDIINQIFEAVPRDRMGCLVLSVMEIISVLVRKRNGGQIAADIYRQALAELNQEIIQSDGVRKRSAPDAVLYSSIPHIDQFSLNSTDAIVLQSARFLKQELTTDDRVIMVASDRRLLRACEHLKIDILNPEDCANLD